ncbi:MAG: hypothetical protein KGP10_03840 [Actinomycetales bacterium]|nr:hypothetical protein [Actinomycetales bacterium]
MAILESGLAAPRARYRSAAAAARQRTSQRAEQRSRMSAARFAVLVIGLLLGALISSLLLTTLLAADAFTLSELRATGRDLAVTEEQLAQQVSVLESPTTVARRARALGMVPAPGPAFLYLSDGRIVGGGVPIRLARPLRAAGVDPVAIGR